VHQGFGQNQFASPAGIAIDSADRIYVADFVNDRLVRIDDMSGIGWIATSSESGTPGATVGPCAMVDT
jgi:hypothetical protein